MFTAMNLFVNDINTNHNYLPKDGIVNYYGKVISKPAADEFYAKLLENVQWENDQAIIFGKLIITARKVAWYGDQEFNYTYSKITKKALLWTPEILALKYIAEQESGEQFNSCLLNLYHNILKFKLLLMMLFGILVKMAILNLKLFLILFI